MELRLLFLVFSGLGVLYMASRTSSQYINDPKKLYKNMTFNFDVRHRGGLGVPSCAKQLMECWELVTGQVICAHFQYYESVCMLMRNRHCHEIAPFGELGWPYDNFQMAEEYCAYYNYYNYYNFFTRRRLELAGYNKYNN